MCFEIFNTKHNWMIKIGAPSKINIPAEIYIISLSAVQENESNGKYEVNTERYVDVKKSIQVHLLTSKDDIRLVESEEIPLYEIWQTYSF